MDRPTFRRLDFAAVVDRLTEQVENPSERGWPHGHGERAPGVDNVGPADQAVGTTQRNAPHLAATEVLLHLADQVQRHALFLTVDADGVVDRGDAVLRKLDVESRADHLRDVSDGPACCLGRRRHDGSCSCNDRERDVLKGMFWLKCPSWNVLSCFLPKCYFFNASTPPRISMISPVICDCRARL